MSDNSGYTIRKVVPVTRGKKKRVVVDIPEGEVTITDWMTLEEAAKQGFIQKESAENPMSNKTTVQKK